MWKLKGTNNVEEFYDIRMKVGNKIIRSYLLDKSFKENRVDKTKLSLRGPKNDFFDAAKFLVVRIHKDDESYAFLIQAGVYSNLRIVGSNSEKITRLKSDEIVDLVTEPLENPSKYDCRITLSDDTKVTAST
ncbi:MAG: hypothetical protein R6V83_02145 [Candidatus Thorarchaeota archaeon]